LELGGAQGNTVYTAEHLLPEFDVMLWTGRGAYWDQSVQANPLLGPRIHFFRSLVRPLNPVLDLIAVIQLSLRLKRERPAIMHTHSSKAGIIGRVAGRLARVPIVIHTFHGFGFNDHQKRWTRAFFVLLERLTASMASKLIFVSQANLEEARALGIGRPEQYELIRSGVPLDAIGSEASQVSRAGVRAALGIPFEAHLITTIGAFKPQKNLSDFLRMAAEVSRKQGNAYFLIIGDGMMRDELDAQIKMLGLKGKVLMPGWRKDVVGLLGASDVFVLTSLWEGLPRALVEAICAGVPSLCFETDGVRDLLKVEDGFTTPKKDWKALADKVLEWLAEPARAQAAARVQRGRVTNDFDIDVMVQQQKALYRDLLARQK
jgi:glycosyltransferase involved in cell wall biosynthesis